MSGLREGLISRLVLRQNVPLKQLSFLQTGQGRQSFLITGGSGFIGQSLVEQLLGEGHQVTLLTRNPLSTMAQFQSRVSCIQHIDELASTHYFDVVVNLAGERILGKRWSTRQKERLLSSRVGTTQALNKWIQSSERKPRLFISGSAVGYFGVQALSDNSELTEESPSQAIFISQLCLEWEQAAAACVSFGVEVVCLRFGMVLGRQGALPMLLLPVSLGLGGAMGGGKQSLSWVHIEDVLGVIAWLCRKPSNNPVFNVYNTVAPHHVTQDEFIKMAANLLSRPAIMPVPGFIIRVLLGEQATILLDGQRVAPTRLLREGYEFSYPNLTMALKHLVGVK